MHREDGRVILDQDEVWASGFPEEFSEDHVFERLVLAGLIRDRAIMQLETRRMADAEREALLRRVVAVEAMVEEMSVIAEEVGVVKQAERFLGGEF